VSTLPKSIDRSGEADLKITWQDGEETIFKARSLRLECPCAQCVHEVTGVKLLNPKTVPEDVKPLKIDPIGNYAIMIEWSDHHKTGIYAYDFLKKLAERMNK